MGKKERRARREMENQERGYQKKILLLLFLTELMFLLYSVLVLGKGVLYLQIAAVLIPLSLGGLYLVFRMKADQYLIIWTILLLNFGFMVQLAGIDKTNRLMTGTIGKLLIAAVAAVAAGFIFSRFSYILSMDWALAVLVAAQMVLILFLWVFGKATGGDGEQSAVLNLAFFQPLEIVKFIYIFVMAILLCKSEKKDSRILGMPRELAAIIYTLFTVVGYVLCRELGLMLVILCIGAGMIVICGRNRRTIWLEAVGVLGAAGILGILCMIFYEKEGSLFRKIYLRFQYMIRPELDYLKYGYQGLQIRKALTVGGLLGPDTQRYVAEISREQDDMIFCKLIQTCGLLLGFILLGAVILYLREGCKIAQRSKDSYYQGLAIGMTLAIASQSVIHVALNVGVFPITGIPFYFISNGFTYTTIGLVMTAFLLVISTGIQERSSYDEERLENGLEKAGQRILRRRRRKS